MDTLALILAGGRGTRVDILSEQRVKPSIPFAGKYRIIDFTLSNCTNSGIFDIAIMTQYLPLSLVEHIGVGRPWDLDRRDAKLTMLQPHKEWYEGTADAVLKNIEFVERSKSKYVLILSGDHIYRMDYREVLKQHIELNAEITVCAKVVEMDEASRFGILAADETKLIIDFEEKPKEPKSNLASMGIYVFNRDVLLELLRKNKEPNLDFGKHLIPRSVGNRRMYAFSFDGYWRDVGTYDAYLEANLELTQTYSPDVLDMYDPNWKFYTKSEDLPAVKISRTASIKKALLSNGAIISGTVERSVLSPGVIIHGGATVINSVLLNGVRVREGAYIENCIIDKNCDIGVNARIGVGDDFTPNVEKPDVLFSGITVLAKRVIVPNEAVIGKNCRIYPVEDLSVYHEPIQSGTTLGKSNL
jgi:glucose-1-phosphate adenylyltransferase